MDKKQKHENVSYDIFKYIITAGYTAIDFDGIFEDMCDIVVPIISIIDNIDSEYYERLREEDYRFHAKLQFFIGFKIGLCFGKNDKIDARFLCTQNPKRSLLDFVNYLEALNNNSELSEED